MSRELALLLILSSGFFHALWNWIANTYGPKKDDNQVAKGGGVSLKRILLFEGLFSIFANAIFGTWTFQPLRDWVLPGFFAGFGEIAFLFCLQAANRLASVGPTYALTRGSAALFGIPIGMILFEEVWKPLGLLGVILAVMAMAGLKPPTQAGKKPIALALLTGLAIVIYTPGFKAMSAAGVDPIQGQMIGMFPLTVVCAIGLLREGEPLFRPLDCFAGFLTWLSFCLFLVALPHIGAGEAIVLRNISLIFVETLDQWSHKKWEPRRLIFSFFLLASLAMVAIPGIGKEIKPSPKVLKQSSP